MSTFDKKYGSDGDDLIIKFRYSIVAFSLEDVVERITVNYPKYVKIDVDGIEELILNGGLDILKKM